MTSRVRYVSVHPLAVRYPLDRRLRPGWSALQDRHRATVEAMRKVHAASLRDDQVPEDDRGPDKQKAPEVAASEAFTNRPQVWSGGTGGRSDQRSNGSR